MISLMPLRFLTAMSSRLWMARSISRIIFSCSRVRALSLCFMLLISLCMPAASLLLAVGSSVTCVSLDSWIFFSHSSTWRSVSTISSRIWFLLALISEILLSMPTASFSSSLSSWMNSCSVTKLLFLSSSCSFPFRPMRSLSLLISLCRTVMLAFKALSSASFVLMSWSSLTLFWLMMFTFALSSLFLSLTPSVSLAVCTSRVWSLSHVFCSCSHFSSSKSISLLMLLMLASSGPMLSSSSTPSSIFSYFLFSLSTLYIFFSISSFLWRISIWYFSINLSFSLSSMTHLSMVSRSCTLCASVLRVSTLILASSFLMSAASISFSCTAAISTFSCLAKFFVALLLVICSCLFTAMPSSSACLSLTATATFCRTAPSSFPITTPRALTFTSSSKVLFMLLCSMVSLAEIASLSARILATLSSMNFASASSLSLTLTKVSFWAWLFKISRFSPSISVS
mmetsp:Transcript_2412/g.4482  ORF Transcript_2412/g.4482 Transcript_2412/m.4482 type:complete len:455 (-) Transcript_2412:58-1422(-)